ncbi:MAG: creatininase family protein [Burkholderiales bacterium]|nr:creatininase family protein [Burkholderiales bacterium]
MATKCPLRRAAVGLILSTLAALASAASVQLEDLTWTELRDQVAAGTTTALVPVGGTEQSGPHMALGKHNVRVKALAARIAERLGRTVVAPVIAYVPEGAIDPPTQHMKFPGTISIPVPVFEATLAAAARSLCHGGLRDVFFLGDHGGYQASLGHVAAALDREWAGHSNCRAYALGAYYEAAQAPFEKALAARGYTKAEIGTHAGLADTSLMLAVDPALVREQTMREHVPSAAEGVYGDPRRSSAALGRIGIDHVVDASVAAIQERLRTRR